MARILSQTLARILSTRGRPFFGSRSGGITRPLPLSRIVSARLQSSGPDVGQLVELDVGSGADSANVEVLILRLQDAIQTFVIKKSAPEWLPFVPGASYWMTPVPQGLGSLEIVDRPQNEFSKEDALFQTSNHGWPSPSYFLDSKGLFGMRFY